jgi:hypothetical protein
MRRRAARAGGGRTHAGGGARALAPAGASERGARALARLARGGRAGGPPAARGDSSPHTRVVRQYEYASWRVTLLRNFPRARVPRTSGDTLIRQQVYA